MAVPVDCLSNLISMKGLVLPLLFLNGTSIEGALNPGSEVSRDLALPQLYGYKRIQNPTSFVASSAFVTGALALYCQVNRPHLGSATLLSLRCSFNSPPVAELSNIYTSLIMHAGLGIVLQRIPPSFTAPDSHRLRLLNPPSDHQR